MAIQDFGNKGLILFCFQSEGTTALAVLSSCAVSGGLGKPAALVRGCASSQGRKITVAHSAINCSYAEQTAFQLYDVFKLIRETDFFILICFHSLKFIKLAVMLRNEGGKMRYLHACFSYNS